MINLRLRSEYSFGAAFGSASKLIDAAKYSEQVTAVGFTDRASTWGHVQIVKAAGKAGVRPILGVELAVVPSLAKDNSKLNYMGFIARNDAGLAEVYALVTLATMEDQFHFVPRLTYAQVSIVTKDVIVSSGPSPMYSELNQPGMLPPGFVMEIGPNSDPDTAWKFAVQNRRPFMAVSDNYFPRPEDRAAYEIVTGRRRDARTTAMHVLDEWSWSMEIGGRFGHTQTREAIARTYALANECNASVPMAEMVKYPEKIGLGPLCRGKMKEYGFWLDQKYNDRLEYELGLIEKKNYTDYFLVIWDMIRFAKTKMLVGPGRGSSGGSLVCFLLGITEIDPIKHGLLFERFIDINRNDLPDIDIDFPDDRRDIVFEYVAKKYGAACVARLGTIMRYQARSALDIVSKTLKIPIFDVDKIKAVLIERTIGDEERGRCLRDTLETVPLAKEMLEKYPHLAIAAEVEDHTSTTGQHAAGIVITNRPIANFCSMDSRKGVAQIDKYDAELNGLLKIDALGLRTLSVIQDVLDTIKKSREWLVALPLNDEPTFALLNNGFNVGVFQFEGMALRNLAAQMKIERFEDISALSALARPGPLNSGGAGEYIKRRTGQTKVSYYHESIRRATQETFGIIVYQEQVMQIAREMGGLSWEKVSKLRKAIAKSMGDDAVAAFKDEFFKGGFINHGLGDDILNEVWNAIRTMGAYSFNKSHAVAYSVVSYWTALLKTWYPIEFAAACLRHASGDEQQIALLRELDREGIKYVPFDAERSGLGWTIKDGMLVGGLVNIIGIGEKKALEILDKRAKQIKLTPGLAKKLAEGKTPFDHDIVFSVRTNAADINANPAKYGIQTPIVNIASLTANTSGEWLFWGRLAQVDRRDLNDEFYVKMRGDKIPEGRPHIFMAIKVEDDTGSIPIVIGKDTYEEMAGPILLSRIGDLILWKGVLKTGKRKVYINRYLTLPQILKRAEV